MKEILLTLVTAVAAYLLGCISTGTIVSRREGVNIRNEGSHNTGASNVLRVLGLKDGLITFLGDFAKAALACLIGNLLVPSAFGIEGLGRIVAALFVVIGHNWPVFYHFHGGGAADPPSVRPALHPAVRAGHCCDQVHQPWQHDHAADLYGADLDRVLRPVGAVHLRHAFIHHVRIPSPGQYPAAAEWHGKQDRPPRPAPEH